MQETIFVTGGAGFIGSAFCRFLIQTTDAVVVNLDCLTYAANPEALSAIENSPRYRFERADVTDAIELDRVLRCHRPSAVVHLAAESHVDRSISAPAAFLRTNILGTDSLLEATRANWLGLGSEEQAQFRFLSVSTDEVYGSLTMDGLFTETTPYAPSSPYSASKASADHLVNAWHKTYGLPTIVTNCSNNYGPWQHREKLIPRLISNALKGTALPVYGDGRNIRDWLYVEEHAAALYCVLKIGQIGRKYNIGGNAERRNIDVALTICAILDRLIPNSVHRPHANLIRSVADRAGHDFRHAVDITRITAELGWRPVESFESGLEKTVRWYLARHQQLDAQPFSQVASRAA